MIRRYFPGRAAGRDYDAPPLEHLKGTAVVDLLIEEWSAKARRGGPAGPLDADPEARGTAAVIPLREGAEAAPLARARCALMICCHPAVSRVESFGTGAGCPAAGARSRGDEGAKAG